MQNLSDNKEPETLAEGVSKLFIIATIILLFASVFGLWLNFVPTKSYNLLCNISAFIVSAVLLIYLVLYYKEYKTVELKIKVWHSLLSSIVYFGIINIFMTYTAPYIFLPSNNIKDTILKVTGVVDGPWIETHGCQHYITFDLGNEYQGNKVCLSADQTKQYSVGQELLVTANNSSLGMKIINVKTF